jgi:diphthamide synthase (EF-2-diphthine--ammonia ligase)
MKRVLLSWSSGKDSAWTLHRLRADAGVEVAGLLTTFNASADRVAMHAVRRELVALQAAAAGLPLHAVELPWPCPNEAYEACMTDALAKARADGVTHVAFGDLFLEDVRAYREQRLAGTGIAPLFPIWGTAHDTPALASTMRAAGMRAVITCVDPRQLSPDFAGRWWDPDALPPGVDPCGERGELHTFCVAGPMFAASIDVEVGETVERDGFVFADVRPVGSA